MATTNETDRLRTLVETGIVINSELSLDALLERIAEGDGNASFAEVDDIEEITGSDQCYDFDVKRRYFRIVQRGENVAYTYDAEKRVAHRYVFRDGKALYSEAARDLPDPGPFFSPWMGASQVLDRSVAAYARAVVCRNGVADPDYGKRLFWPLHGQYLLIW